MESQNKRLLAYLQAGQSIDPLEAWQELGIYRLSARIHDLRDEGQLISTARKETFNKFGESVTVAEYKLES